jgi:NAD-dependent protein deacetylase/lipoamidase
MVAASNLERAAEILRAAKAIAVLTGAGVSAESGVPTFRDADGLWQGHAVEDVATPEAFRRNPRLVWQFYNERRENLKTVQPNPGHFALARLDERRRRCTIVTQNVDGLHARAGSRTIHELHGNLARTRCTGCGHIEDRGLEPLGDLPKCDRCGALLRPDIVWFHEMLPYETWSAAEAAVEKSDVLLVVGTSAIVHPAAGLIRIAKSYDHGVIECNIQETAASALADISLTGKSGEILPALVNRLT